MPRSTSRPGDLTGRTRDAQQIELAKEIAARADELSLAQAQEEEDFLTQVTDLTQKAAPVVSNEEAEVIVATPRVVRSKQLTDELEEIEVEEVVTSRVIVLVEDLECTIGVGNNYDFKAGKQYLVPENVAQHLTLKGYVR